MLAGYTQLSATTAPSTSRINTPSTWSKPQHDAVHRQGRTPVACSILNTMLPLASVPAPMRIAAVDSGLVLFGRPLQPIVRPNVGRSALQNERVQTTGLGGVFLTAPAPSAGRRLGTGPGCPWPLLRGRGCRDTGLLPGGCQEEARRARRRARSRAA